MKYVFFIVSLITLTTSCELRSTNFDPDEQRVYEDEVVQIASWDQFQTEKLTTKEFENEYAEKYVDAEYTARQNSKGYWIIEGSIKNFSSESYFESTELIASFYNDSNELLGTENYTIQDQLAPGDLAGFYYKSEKHLEATSVRVKVNRVGTAK